MSGYAEGGRVGPWELRDETRIKSLGVGYVVINKAVVEHYGRDLLEKMNGTNIVLSGVIED